MNIKNVKASIAILKRAKKFSMESWQEPGCFRLVSKDVESLHSCGMAACFGGYVALSPEFQAEGGSVCYAGAPAMGEIVGEGAIACWLNITLREADELCCIDGEDTKFYGKDIREVTKEDVIEKLELMLKGEESEA